MFSLAYVVQEEDSGWEWQSLCRDFLFEYHVPSLERVFEEQYGGDLRKFVRDYLEPVLGLLESVRSSAEVRCTWTTQTDLPLYKSYLWSNSCQYFESSVLLKLWRTLCIINVHMYNYICILNMLTVFFSVN